jgi:ABC-type antimicrobial peptide transport system ATPase subunit
MQKVFEIRHLVKEFPGAGSWFRRKQQTVKAINDVSLIFSREKLRISRRIRLR